jgi:hypothetical protein
MYFCEYTKEEKQEVAKQLKNYSFDECANDYNKLQTAYNAGKLNEIKPLSLVGIKFVEHFTYPELLNTKSKQGISFYDFWYNKEKYMNRDNSTKNLIEYIKREKPKLNEIKQAKKVFNLYYGSIDVFRPTIAMKIYDKFKPTCVLDFTMGWGGRLTGFSATTLPKYIGVDYNTNLKEPYQNMCAYLSTVSSMQCDLRFHDALTIDYTSLEYDMVFTSPPFYNKEIYGDKQDSRSKDEWEEKFYIPIFTRTWQGLKPGGMYCLNVPSSLYEKICVSIFGEAVELIEMNKFSRTLPTITKERTNVGQKYKEYIYVWKKN